MLRVISSVIIFFSIGILSAQTPSGDVPKLVVGITIDQLRGDYLEMFRHTFGSRGFNRLLNNGLVYRNINYDFPNLNKASAVTTIFTGANPFYHGIISENRYLLDKNIEVSSFFDDNYLGNFTTEKVSPLPIEVSTISDELIIASNGRSDVFAFAPDASQALASGGHAATGAYWVEDVDGKWATSTFYKTGQPIIERHNNSRESITNSISSLTWKPAINVDKYDAFPYTRTHQSFQHSFNSDNPNSIKLFKQSPYINSEINDMAIRIIESGSLGKRINPDFLAVTFYAGNYPNAQDKNYSVEIQDIYYRLDQELERLLDIIDSSVGLHNSLIFVVSTGYFYEPEIHPEGMITSGGEFFPDRSLALLNMYLMALYGREQWVSKYYDRQFYFNRKLIEDRQINLIEFQQNAAEFLVQSAGIQNVITSGQILHGDNNRVVQYFRNGWHSGISGDLLLELKPGWLIIEPGMDRYARVRQNRVTAPVIFFGKDIKPAIVNRTINATDIAPTLSYRMRIRAPNATEGEIVKELF